MNDLRWLCQDINAFRPPTEGAELGKIFSAAAAEGMWPWRPDTVDLMEDFDIDYNKYRLCVRARKRASWDFAYTVPINRDDILDGYGLWVKDVEREIVQSFRNRPDWPLAPLISLGEN